MEMTAWLLTIALLTLLAASSALAKQTAPAAAQPPAPEVLAADTPRTTVGGNTFVAPAGWKLSVRDRATIVEAPEGNSRVALVDGTAPDTDLAASTKRYYESLAVDRKLLTVPADADASGKLAAHYTSDALGDIAVSHPYKKTVFDFGEWKSEMATRKEPDGSTTFVTISPGIGGLEFIPGTKDKRTLTTRDAQHEYVFKEK